MARFLRGSYPRARRSRPAPRVARNYVVTSRFKLNNGNLVETGKEERRELYPAHKVEFAKGKSSAEITVTLPAYEFKRYAIRARAGQTLTVTSTKGSSASIFKGETEDSEIPNGLRSKLKASGDFVIGVPNNAETEREIMFAIEIK